MLVDRQNDREVGRLKREQNIRSNNVEKNETMEAELGT